jgi:flavorubredoxin
MNQKLLKATKHILEDNLEILKEPYNKNKVVLVYDNNSKLASILAEAYIENLKKYKNIDSEIIDFNTIAKDSLRKKLLNLKSNSTVILVQSTNFRLENFRIRLSLHKA